MVPCSQVFSLRREEKDHFDAATEMWSDRQFSALYHPQQQPRVEVLEDENHALAICDFVSLTDIAQHGQQALSL